jgi:hypothetical protein
MPLPTLNPRDTFRTTGADQRFAFSQQVLADERKEKEGLAKDQILCRESNHEPRKGAIAPAHRAV